MRYVLATLIALAVPWTMQAQEPPRAVATGGVTYVVVVDGAEVSQHTLQHTAQNAAVARFVACEGLCAVEYRLDQSWRIEGDLTAPSEPEPDPEPDPEPEPEPTPEPDPEPTDPPTDAAAHDGFESGDFAGAAGLSWGSPNRTSIVRDDGCVVSRDPPLCGFEARQWEGAPGGGRHAMRFRYPAGQAMAEQRFSLNQPMPDVWISYWIRVPINFEPQSGNNKFFALWMDGYEFEGSGTTATFQTRGTEVSNYQVTARSHTGEGRGGELWTASDRGRWAHVVIHVRAGSNGVVEQWRRWEDEASYDLLYQQSRDMPLVGPGFQHGYLMGWANDAYPTDTEFLVDEFTISTGDPR